MIPLSLDVLTPLTALGPVVATVGAAALKGAVVIGVAATAAATLLRQRPAAARHAVWTGALAAHLVLVAAAPLLPAISSPVFRLPPWLSSSISDAPTLAVGLPEVGTRGNGPVGDAPLGVGPRATDVNGVTGGVSTAVTVTGGASATASASVTATGTATPLLAAQAHLTASPGHSLDGASVPGRQALIPLLWLFGVILVLARLALGAIRVHKLSRMAERITDAATLSLAQRTAGRLGIGRPITLLRGDRLTIPITWGVVYPAVLLPAESDHWSAERRRVVLVHEMAHVKRFDALTQLVAQLAAAIFWFDPLVWLAARRMRAEREHACDDYVLRDGTRPSLYANELLEMVRRLGATTDETVAAPAFAALAMARRSEFEGRMLAILDPVVDRRVLSRATSGACALVAFAMLLPLAAVRPAHARAHAPAAPAAAAARRATTVPVVVPVERRSAAALASLSNRAPSPTPARGAEATAAAVRAPQAPESLPIMYRCTKADVRSSNNTYAIHTDHEKPGRNFIEHYAKRYGRCLHVVLVGRVAFTPDERDISSLAPDARVQLHERTLEWDRALVVTSDSGGTLRRAYSANGRPAPFDASARAWVARLMQDLARESGADVPARVSRIRAKGGLAAVLDEIGEIESGGAKRKHYEALFASGNLTSAEVDMVVRHAGRELAGSSGDLRAVLRQVPSAGSTRSAVSGALEEAVSRLGDGDKHEVLVGMLDSADPATLLVVLRLTERIGSDGEKAAVLRRAAARALDGSTAAHRDAFFRAYATIGSDGEKHAVLVAAVRRGQKSPALTRDIIRGASRIGSDGEKASVLLSLAKNRLLTTEELRDEYIKVARTIGSDGEYRSVIDAVIGVKS